MILWSPQSARQMGGQLNMSIFFQQRWKITCFERNEQIRPAMPLNAVCSECCNTPGLQNAQKWTKNKQTSFWGSTVSPRGSFGFFFIQAPPCLCPQLFQASATLFGHFPALMMRQTWSIKPTQMQKQRKQPFSIRAVWCQSALFPPKKLSNVSASSKKLRKCVRF